MHFFKLRTYYILLSQLLGASYCIYFILNVQHYEVSWRLLSWAFPGMVSSINNLLSHIGTLILIVPLTIIIMSFLMPESYKLKLTSTFFGTASTIFFIISGFMRNTLGQVYNMGIFSITKILSLAEKQEVFKTEFMESLEHYKNNIKLFNFLSELMLEKHFTILNTKLVLLKEQLAIKLYAHDLLENSIKVFNNATANEQYNYYMEYTKYALYVGAGIAVTLIVIVFIRTFVDTNVLIEGAKLSRDSAILGAATNDGLLATQQTAQEGITLTKELCLELVKVASDLQSEAVSRAFDKITQKFTHYDEALDVMSQTLKQLTVDFPKPKTLTE